MSMLLLPILAAVAALGADRSIEGVFVQTDRAAPRQQSSVAHVSVPNRDPHPEDRPDDHPAGHRVGPTHVEIAFTGGSAMDYIDLVRTAGRELGVILNVVAKPGLADLPLPPMNLVFPVDIAAEAALASIGGLQFPVGERTVAEIRIHQADHGVAQVWADFVTRTADGRSVTTLRPPTPSDLAPPRLPEPPTSLQVHVLAGDDVVTATELLTTTLRLAGLAQRSDWEVKDGVLLLRTTPEGHDLVDRALGARRRRLDGDPARLAMLEAALAERDALIDALEARITRLETALATP